MKRIDLLLVEKNLTSGREGAKRLILARQVSVNNEIILKPSEKFDDSVEIKIIGEVSPYVSRGGLKLEKAIATFNINLNGKICADIGASTGGFTQCMLLHGGKKVYAIDVGSDQMDKRLLADHRVVNIENVNIKNMNLDLLSDPIEFIAVDVSFISLTHVLPKAYEMLISNGEMVCLVKPQFEAGRGKVGKKGIVKDKGIHKEVLENIVNFCLELGFCVLALDYSPITGAMGNIEFLMHLKKGREVPLDYKNIIDIVVDKAENTIIRGI